MTASPRTLADRLADPILDQIPRLLTQVDRNLHSPTYGCCCRNHWHYRIEDIANSQMQELVLTLALAWKWNRPDNPYYQSEVLLEWIEAILAYTIRIQRRSGSFDEVYRGQDSYAATAFVTFCVSETLVQLGRSLTGSLRNDIDGMLFRAALWLGKTEEHLAGNQVAGAAAAFMNLATLDPDRGYEEGLDELLDTLAAMQSSEGWFPEYGGADVGYTAIAHSYLALIAHRKGDNRARSMADAAARFLALGIHRDGTVGGLYGSRNTAYLMPVGVVLDADRNADAAAMRNWLKRHLESGVHAIVTESLDDRYLAYLSPFYLLAAHETKSRRGDRLANVVPAPHHTYLPESGIWSVENKHLKLVANLRKGGVFHLDLGDWAYVDSGFFGEIPDGQIVTTQYLDPGAEVTVEGDRARLACRIVVNTPVTITPWKNMAFRAFNLMVPAFLRRQALDLLRDRAVRAGNTVGTVLREIAVEESALTVTDHIKVEEPVLNLVLRLDTERAFSFASTGFCEVQELATGDGSLPVDLAEGTVTLRRRYSVEGGLVVEP